MNTRSKIVGSFLVLLAPTLSYGIACSENFESAGKPTFIPKFSEVTPEQEKVLVLGEKPISIKPRISKPEGDITLLSFPGIPETQLQVYVTQSDLLSVRPDAKVIQGYRRYEESAEVVKNIEETLVNSRSNKKLLAFGIPGKEPKVVSLSPLEIPATMVSLNPNLRILATLEAGEPLGFGVARKKTYLVRLYYIEPGSYAMTSFRVPYTEKFPMVKFFQSKGKELILDTGEKKYAVTLTPSLY